ncbi:hypothetical protein KDA_31850 [Dictyobacter alpinus]|uniref:Uncharacterized protein n=1 Tax=Dictyobacter alpinus TaxID=2014873 RepID=A0A402B8K3_9CHLR|nr:hypothetical protein [Dictyobacter alpinus]GCE27701.1 hypothetical protein KDA_31850 [Dictyobacter alpinus]
MDKAFEDMPGDLVEMYAQHLFDSLQKMDTSAEVTLCPTCVGVMWYEWWIAGQHGMSPTFADAVQEMYARKQATAA